MAKKENGEATVVCSTLDVAEASESREQAKRDMAAADKSLKELLAKQEKDEGKAHENPEGNDKSTS